MTSYLVEFERRNRRARGSRLLASQEPRIYTSASRMGFAYYYIVTAVNAGGESSASSQASATPQVSAPSAPTGVGAVAGNAQVTVSWSAVSGATSYNLYWSNSSGVTTSTGTKTTSVTSPYIHSSLTNGIPNYYIVTAVNAGGESSASSQASATPQVPAPSAPTGVGAVAGNAQVTVELECGQRSDEL